MSCHLVYKGDRAILIDPGVEWELVKKFIEDQNLRIVYILVTGITFETTYLIAEIKKVTGAKFLCFESDLLKLRHLPKWADEKNVCGVKIPHADGFLKLGNSDDLEEFQICVVGDENSREYQIGKLRVGPK